MVTNVGLLKFKHLYKMSIKEIRMLRQMCGHTRLDKIKNDHICQKVKVAHIEDKIRKMPLEMVCSCPVSTYRIPGPYV